MPSEPGRTAFDLGLAVLAGAVLLGMFDVDTDGTAVAVGAAAGSVVAAALLAGDRGASVTIAGGVLGGYALALSLVGPDVGWVYPAPSLPVVVGAAALLAVPLGTLADAVGRLRGREVRDNSGVPAAVVGLATAGSLLFVAGLPRTLWPLPSWHLAGTAGCGIAAVAVARGRRPTGSEVRLALRQAAAGALLCGYVLLVAVAGVLLVTLGAAALVGLARRTVHPLAGYGVVAVLVVAVVESVAAATVPAVRLARRVRLAPGFAWPPYPERRTLAAVAAVPPGAVGALALYPASTPLEASLVPSLAVAAVTAAGYGAVLSRRQPGADG